MGIALQIRSVFEGARLAFVDVHRHQARSRLRTHDAPLASGRKSCATQAAQTRRFHVLHYRLDGTLPRHYGLQQRIAATGTIRCVAGICWRFVGVDLRRCGAHTGLHPRLGIAGCIRCTGRCAGALCLPLCQYGFCRCMGHRVVVYRHRRSLLTAPNAGRRDHADAGVIAQQLRQLLQQGTRAADFAAQSVAHPDGCGKCRVSIFYDFKMVIKSCHFKHFGHTDAQGRSQGHQMPLVQAVVLVIQPVQILDKHVPAQRQRADQRRHFLHRLRIGLAPFEFAFVANAHAHVINRSQYNRGRLLDKIRRRCRVHIRVSLKQRIWPRSTRCGKYPRPGECPPPTKRPRPGPD